MTRWTTNPNTNQPISTFGCSVGFFLNHPSIEANKSNQIYITNSVKFEAVTWNIGVEKYLYKLNAR